MKKLILTLAVLVCAGQLFAQNQSSQLSDQQKAMMKAFHLVTPEDIHTFSYELLKMNTVDVVLVMLGMIRPLHM